MLKFTLRQLEYFVAVGEHGSIAQAAERLHVSSPSISAAISQLEAQFGLPHFAHRKAQGLTLTPAGARMLAQARKVLAEANGLNDIAGDITGAVRGPLALGCLATFAQVVLPEMRRSFESTHGEVHVRQSELNQAEIISRLRRAELDAALTYDLDVPEDLHFTPLLTLSPWAVFSADHPLANRAEVSAEELAPLPMVLLDLPLSTDYFMSHFSRAGLRPHIAERTRDMAVMRSMVGRGFGYSIANMRPLSERAPDGSPLIFVPLEASAPPLRMGLLTAASAAQSGTLRALPAHCQSLASDGTLPRLLGHPKS